MPKSGPKSAKLGISASWRGAGQGTPVILDARACQSEVLAGAGNARFFYRALIRLALICEAIRITVSISLVHETRETLARAGADFVPGSCDSLSAGAGLSSRSRCAMVSVAGIKIAAGGAGLDG
jgi:hypothetical protein